MQLGYCTNVHAGADLTTTRDNLQRYALAVKDKVAPERPMGVGLWLSAAAAHKLQAERKTDEGQAESDREPPPQQERSCPAPPISRHAAVSLGDHLCAVPVDDSGPEDR